MSSEVDSNVLRLCSSSVLCFGGTGTNNAGKMSELLKVMKWESLVEVVLSHEVCVFLDVSWWI